MFWVVTRLAGDVAYAHAKGQQFHSDAAGLLQLTYSQGPYSVLEKPFGGCEACMAFSVAVHNIDPCTAPIRMSKWSSMQQWLDETGGLETPATEELEPSWLASRLPMPRGAVLARDVRLWHGGSSNLTNVKRSLPGWVICSQTMMTIG